MRLNHPAQEGVMPCTVQGWPASACFVNIPPRGYNVLKTQVKTKSQKDAQVRRPYRLSGAGLSGDISLYALRRRARWA